MAQTGYTPLQIYSSSTGGAAPAAGNLTNSTLGSELAINITDGKLFYKDNGGNVQVIAWKTTPTTAGGTGLTSYTAGDLLYYATGTTLAKLGIGASTTVLTSSGTAPQWTAQSALSVGEALNLKSNATTGVMQIVGPGAGTTQVMTIPNANFTVARTDSAQTFTGIQTFSFNTTDYTVKILNTLNQTTGHGLYVQTRWNVAGNYVARFATNSGSTNVLTVEGNSNVTVDTGNLVIGTSGKGIDFSANSHAAGMTSELLNWYEEGTYTATLTPSTSGSILMVSAFDLVQYTRIGRLVTVSAQIRIDSVSSPVGTYIKLNLPFTIASLSELAGRGGGCVNYNGTVIPMFWETGNNFVYLSKNASTAATGQDIYFSFSYVA